VLSIILLLGSGVLYLMGHDSIGIGMASSAQLVYIFYMCSQPATVDLQAWGSHGYPAALALSAGSTIQDRWILPLALYGLALAMGAIYKRYGLSRFRLIEMTTTGAEYLGEANPAYLARNSREIIARLLSLRACQWIVQVTRFPLLAWCILGLKREPNNSSIFSLSLIVLFIICVVTCFSLNRDIKEND
jgi:hypothetical protein